MEFVEVGVFSPRPGETDGGLWGTFVIWMHLKSIGVVFVE